jgi:hypothetical protein
MQHVRGRREVHTAFLWGNVTEGNHLKGPGVDERIILKWILQEWDGDMVWIDLAHDRAFINAVMNLRVRYHSGNFLSS